MSDCPSLQERQIWVQELRSTAALLTRGITLSNRAFNTLDSLRSMGAKDNDGDGLMSREYKVTLSSGRFAVMTTADSWKFCSRDRHFLR
jgi:hypothetical protein